MIPRTLFSGEHDTFRDTVRRFIATEITPHHQEWEKAGQVPRELWRKAGATGLLCCAVPEEYGGMGGDFLHSTILIEEMARAGATGPTFYLHSEIIAPYFLEFGSEAQKRHWLPRMAAGEVILALGMTEPSSGSDLQGMRTTAVRDGDDYVINGQKVFITNGTTADLLVLSCKTDPRAGAKGISLILVETDRPGFQRGRRLEKIGCKAQDTAELFFADLRVPASNLLGKENRGFYHLMTQLTQERLVQAVRASPVDDAAWPRHPRRRERRGPHRLEPGPPQGPAGRADRNDRAAALGRGAEPAAPARRGRRPAGGPRLRRSFEPGRRLRGAAGPARLSPARDRDRRSSVS